MSVIYVKHPLSSEQKAKLLKLGKIVDAKFAPKGADILDADGVSLTKPKTAPKPKAKAAE
jgi:hypothetical protein